MGGYGTVSSSDKPLVGEVEHGLGWSPDFKNVIVCSLGFLSLFSAYNTLQSFATSLFPGNLGNWSMTVLYGAVVLTVMFAPSVVRHLGEVRAMIFGATLYVVYLVSLVHLIPWLVICTSVIIGFGGAVLWVAQGAFIVRCSPPHTRGRNAGVFWSIFQFSNLFGNLAAYFVFDDVSESALFIMFSALGALGVFILLFVKEYDPRFGRHVRPDHPNNSSFSDAAHEHLLDADGGEHAGGSRSGGGGYVTVASSTGNGRTDHHHNHAMGSDKEDNKHITISYHSTERLPDGERRAAVLDSLSQTGGDGGVDDGGAVRGPGAVEIMVDDDEAETAALRMSTLDLIKDTASMLLIKEMIWLMPIIFASGYELAFWSGEFPRLLDKHVIGLVLIFAGVGEILGGVTSGYLNDVLLGSSKAMLFGTVVYGSGLFMSAMIKNDVDSFMSPSFRGAPWSAFVAATCFGYGDAAFNTGIMTMIGKLFAHRRVGAVTVLQLMQNLGSASGFYLNILLPLHGPDGTFVQLWLQLGMFLAGCVFFAAAVRFGRRASVEEGDD